MNELKFGGCPSCGKSDCIARECARAALAAQPEAVGRLELESVCAAADAGAGGWVSTARLRELLAAAPTEAAQPPSQPSAAAEREALIAVIRGIAFSFHRALSQAEHQTYREDVEPAARRAKDAFDGQLRAAISSTPPAQAQDAVDAERYRWLRNHHGSLDAVLLRKSSDGTQWLGGEGLDRSIDAAISAKKGQP